MKKVKVFVSTSASDLENQINVFLAGNTDINIETELYQITTDGTTVTFSYVLRYQTNS